MRLSAKAIKKIKKTNRIKNRLALTLNVSGYTVVRWLTENEENGSLTKAVALEIIKSETGFGDREILEEIKEYGLNPEHMERYAV